MNYLIKMEAQLATKSYTINLPEARVVASSPAVAVNKAVRAAQKTEALKRRKILWIKTMIIPIRNTV